MKERIELIEHQSLRASLEDSERQAMRESLIAYIGSHPIRQSAVNREPWWKFWKRNSTIVVLIIILAGVCVMLFARQAPPGTALYSVKHYVNDRVEGFFAAFPSHSALSATDSAAKNSNPR